MTPEGGFEPPQMPRPDLEPPHHGDRGRDDRPTAPSAESMVHGDDSSRARRMLPAAVAAALAAALVAVLLVWGPGSLVARDAEDPPTSPTPVGTAPLPPELPDEFAGYRRDPGAAATSAGGAADDDLAVAAATYTRNGRPSVLLIAARPVVDMEQFLLSLGASGIRPTGGGFCAEYDGVTLCGVAHVEVGWAVSPLAEQGPDELVRIAGLAAAA